MNSMEYEREHWPLIDDLFAAALDHPPEERTAFIDRACTGNPALRDELESLLRAYHASEHYLEAIDADRARALIESVGELVCEEQRIGPYQVVRELGRGGMGAVFLAERADGQFEQQVALKLIKRGMDSDAILRRFLRERQILAHLRHENIARLLDGGVSDEDRPYFAMEYIDGLPLPDYCDTHRLDVEARLRLFQDVCRAVQYAHRSLIVHRDLKPSNMLVTEDGTVKLLDFGIAKLLDPEAQSGATALTEAGLRAMTPEYAAPEQVRGEPVTTATDVYTLGVVLYELLTGHRPYQFERREPKAIARVINDVEPELPSTAVRRETDIQHTDGTTETVTPLSVSRARSTQPDRLRRRLSGDLDTVVLKALRKEPERRYASAEAFVEDIRRHLAGLPVLAQKDTLAYRASKFVRRHTVGVVFATALGLLTLGSAVVMALQQAETMREAAKAEEVKSFVMSLFEMSDPDASKGETITAREMLDAGAARIETELADQPEVQAEMMDMMGEVYWKLGLYDPAQPLFERALTLRRTLLGNEHEDVATSLNNLALLLYEKGDYDTAEPLFREALAMRRKLLGQEHPDVAISLNHLALLLRRTGDYDAAEPLYREALAMKRKLLGEEHPSIAIGLNNLALLLRDKGDYDAAVPFLREAVVMWRKVQGEEHTEVATGLNNLALLLRDKGDYDAAEPLYREALAMKRKLLGREHPDVAITLSGLAELLRRKGDYDAAEPLFRETLVMRRKLLGREHPRVATSLNRLAATLAEKGDYDAAEPLFREALSLCRRTLPEGHTRTAEALLGLGEVMLAKEQPTEAEPLLREAVQIRQQALPEGHWRRAEAASVLGACLSALGRFDEAEPLLLDGYNGLNQTRGAESLFTRRALQHLTAHYRRRGLPDQAAAYQALAQH